MPDFSFFFRMIIESFFIATYSNKEFTPKANRCIPCCLDFKYRKMHHFEIEIYYFEIDFRI